MALELQESAVEAAGDDSEDEDDEAGIRREGAIAAVEATAALVRALPPGAGSAARDAISAGLLAKRTLGSILRIAAERLTAAVKPPPGDGGEGDALAIKHGGVRGELEGREERAGVSPLLRRGRRLDLARVGHRRRRRMTAPVTRRPGPRPSLRRARRSTASTPTGYLPTRRTNTRTRNNNARRPIHRSRRAR